MAVMSAQELQDIKDNSDLIFSSSQIKTAVETIGLELEKSIRNKNAILLCVMNGGLVFTSDLMRSLDCNLRLDYLQVARYMDKTVGGSLHWHTEPQLSLQDQVIVIADDIYDEGYTMEELVSYCKKHGAKEVITVVLLLKQKASRQVDLKPDLFGLEVEDRYVYGYGMDYQGHLRNVPDIYAIPE
ncbi:MAG: hypoxanthine-guanine phosphoribosyltransferase [Pseudomonadota bacterium]